MNSVLKGYAKIAITFDIKNEETVDELRKVLTTDLGLDNLEDLEFLFKMKVNKTLNQLKDEMEEDKDCLVNYEVDTSLNLELDYYKEEQ